jgi:hypothetical protein
MIETIWFSNDGGIEETEKKYPELQLFSVLQDLKLEQKPIRIRYRTLNQDYRRFVNSKKSSLKPEEVTLLDQMYILRLNNLINQLEDEIKAGKMIAQILGVTDSNIRKQMDRFCREYRKLIKARESLGYIPKINQERVDDTYKAMIAEVRKEVFAPVIQLFSWDPSDQPQQEGLDDTAHQVLATENGFKLEQLHELIVGAFKAANINAKVDLTGEVIQVSLPKTEEETKV